ncbi:MAG TPA: M28 family peptidase [bacterium]|nr:M28 family peptidase [bacterium]
MPRDPEQSIKDAVSAAKLMTYTREISRWVRLSGSDEERLAFDYLEAILKEFGLAVRRYQHDALVSWPGNASVEVTGAGARRVECITHAFSASTPASGLEGQVVDAGREPLGQSVRGKIALVDGLASPARARAAEQGGAAGLIFINPPELHEMIISAVWGSPTPESVGALPKIVAVSIRQQDGGELRAQAQRGDLRVRLHAAVDTRWRKTPLLVADLAGQEEPDRFVLFSGHVDSWHHGAMDNGSANAVMVEMARLFSRRQKRLRRGVRFAFWSGHSHGRYSGSTWYADTHWDDLYRHAVLHLNVDSTGGMGATLLSEALTMAETWALAARCIKDVTGQDLQRRRITRMGDQSFWGIGLPSMFVDVSAQPPGESATGAALKSLTGGTAHHGGLGWWWHTTEDTLDKIDKANLHRDAQVYALALWRWCTAPVLPLDYRETAAELRETLRGIQEAAGDSFDMRPPLGAVERFTAAAGRLHAAAERIGGGLHGRGTKKQREASAAINSALMLIGRALIPINYTATGPFDHDPALPVQPVPVLQPAARLRTTAQGSDESLTLLTRLTRERNKVTHAIDTATEIIERTLERIGERQ